MSILFALKLALRRSAANPVARVLRHPQGVFRPRVKSSRRLYRRHPKHPGRARAEAMA
jgi:hypothetical protein